MVPIKHLSSSLRDKTISKRERCEFCNLLFPGNKIEKHKEGCSLPQNKKLVLDVKSIKFSERVQKKKCNKNGVEVNDSLDCKFSRNLK